jgi:NTE family protein
MGGCDGAARVIGDILSGFGGSMVLLHCNMNVAMQHSRPHIAIATESALATLRRCMLPLLLAMLTGWLRKRVSPPPLPAKAAKRTFRGPRKRINLALQGGGAHGAFTWGVLDQLLADERVEIDGISGTSAGAINAVLIADGLNRGGREEARTRLADFWRAVSIDGQLSDVQRAVAERLFAFVPRDGLWFGTLSRLFSPYDLNPLNINPLKELLERFVDFEALRKNPDRELFVSATNVHTGEIRIFTREEITAEVVTASACLPLLFRAVEIDGIPYWDGGYSGNPPLIPFLRATGTEDLLIVQINPRERRKTPTRTREILTRMNEINFNASLLSELRGVSFVNRLIDEGRLPRGTDEAQFRQLRLHRIAMEELGDADRPSTLARDYQAFEMLHKRGQRAARRFLDSHSSDIGRRSTIDEPAAVEPELVA